MMFSPHHGDPEQARLMSDMIKAEGQSSILSPRQSATGLC